MLLILLFGLSSAWPLLPSGQVFQRKKQQWCLALLFFVAETDSQTKNY